MLAARIQQTKTGRILDIDNDNDFIYPFIL
jgi:hypothetical protein